jgi:ABC-type uncharacterized transport system permease subunit
VTYLPAARILDKRDVYNLPSWFGLAAPGVAVVVAVAGHGVWTLALRHYRSTGS